VIETKDWIPTDNFDWVKNPITAPDALEEYNMSNISLTIKVDISFKPDIVENVSLGASCSPTEVVAYKGLFQ